jgi:hypothetical protein
LSGAKNLWTDAKVAKQVSFARQQRLYKSYGIQAVNRAMCTAMFWDDAIKKHARKYGVEATAETFGLEFETVKAVAA